MQGRKRFCTLSPATLMEGIRKMVCSLTRPAGNGYTGREKPTPPCSVTEMKTTSKAGPHAFFSDRDSRICPEHCPPCRKERDMDGALIFSGQLLSLRALRGLPAIGDGE